MMMMMNTPFLSNNNCSHPALVFKYGTPMFFTVEPSAQRCNKIKRNYSAFTIDQQTTDLDVSTSKRARSVPTRCKRTFSDLVTNHKSYRNEEEEVAEEEPVVSSPSKRTRTTLFVVSTSPNIQYFNPMPATTIINQEEELLNEITSRFSKLSLAQSQDEEEIKSITERLENLSLAPSHEEEMESLTSRMKNLYLTQSQEEKIKSITYHMSKLSLTQSQEEE